MNSLSAKASTYADLTREIKLNYQTDDIISNVTFSPKSSPFLLISSWDGYVTLFDVKENAPRTRYDHGNPVLDCCFLDESHCYSGGLEHSVIAYDFNSGKQTKIGCHDKAVKAVEYSPDANLLISGGWDSQVKMWDSRMGACVGTLLQPERVYTLALCGDKFIVGTAGRKVYVWDLKNLGYVLQRRESSLKYQTRCIKSFPDYKGYVLSSIEGRVAFEYIDSRPEIQKQKYAFKCHRWKENGIEKIYPVNTISFHPKHSTFATGGSDGYVNIWDGDNKKRLHQFHPYPTSVTSVCFNNDGSCLAIAYSHLYDETPPPPEEIPESSVNLMYPSSTETSTKC